MTVISFTSLNLTNGIAKNICKADKYDLTSSRLYDLFGYHKKSH